MDRDKRIQLAQYSRRKMLGTAGATGLGLIAGCLGDDDDTDLDLADAPEDDADIEVDDAEPDDSDAEEIVDQAFVVPTTDNPEDNSVTFEWTWMMDLDVRYGDATDVLNTMKEPPSWGVEYWALPGDSVELGLLERVDIHDEKIEFEFRDDAYWSDGEPVRAMDGPPHQFMAYRMQYTPEEGRYVYEDPDDQHAVPLIFDDYNFPDGPDGKVWELTTYHDNHIGNVLEDPANQGGFWLRTVQTFVAAYPTHIEPYESLANDILDEVDHALETGYHRTPPEIANEHIDNDTYEKFRDPDNILSCGPWVVDEIRGAEEWVLRPNEYSRHAEHLNFNEVRMPWIEEDHRKFAELQAGRLDYGQHNADPDMTQDLQDQGYSLRNSRSDYGGWIGFDLSDPVFGRVDVRRAIAFAIDQYEVAETYHPEATRPVEYSGAQIGGEDVVIGEDWEDWLNENLISYNQDLDKAEELMVQAGFEREDGIWLNEGDPIEFEYPTPEDTPIQETVVVDQLNDFGFQVQLQPYDEDIYVERFNNGEFRIFPHGSRWGFRGIVGPTSVFDQYPIWAQLVHDEENLGRNVYSPEGINREMYQMAEDGYDRTTILQEYDPYVEVPPIGERDATPEPFYLPDIVDEGFYRGGFLTGSDEWAEVTKKLIWVSNWLLPDYYMFTAQDQHFLNMENWNWPTDHSHWDVFADGSDTPPNIYLASGLITANADNPK